MEKVPAFRVGVVTTSTRSFKNGCDGSLPSVVAVLESLAQSLDLAMAVDILRVFEAILASFRALLRHEVTSHVFDRVISTHRHNGGHIDRLVDFVLPTLGSTSPLSSMSRWHGGASIDFESAFDQSPDRLL